MKVQSIKVNFILQILYQLIILLIPLITAPYLTRVLGSENLGIYTFTYSIAYYFVLFASLGIVKYGQRIIASRRNDIISLRKTFWSLYLIHLFFSVISLVAYFVVIHFVNDNNKIYLLQGFFVSSALFDITWLFYGLENFKSVVLKNLVVKLMSTICIFIFIKGTNDLKLYTFIMSLSILIGYMVMLPQAISVVKPIKITWGDCKEHIKPLLVLSIAVVAVTLYTIFDKTLIGIFINNDSVAFYEYSDKIIRIPLTIISVIGTVLYPRACACYSNKDYDGMKKYFKFSLIFTFFIGFGSVFGLICVSDLFVLHYYGPDFFECSKIIKFMTPLIIIISFGDIVRTQFLIPMEKDFQYTIILVVNAILNICLSLILIPIIGVYGAVVGTVCAESFGLISEVLICRKFIDFKSIFVCVIPPILSSILMVISLLITKRFIDSSIFHLIVQIVIGVITYSASYLLFIRIFCCDFWKYLIDATAVFKNKFNKNNTNI